MRSLARLLLSIALLSAASLTQAQNTGAPIWEVTSKTNTVYLLGTIHVGSPALYPLPAAIENAYAKSRVLALEADPTDPTAVMAAMAAATYTPPETLERNIPPALYRDVVQALSQRGLPPELAQSMKPFMVALTLTMLEIGRLGYDPSLGIDLHLASRARQDGKVLVELESMAMQIDLMAGLPAPVQTAMLDSTVRSLKGDVLANDMKAMMGAWRRGDLSQLEAVSMRDIDAMPAAAARELKETLYDRRNRAMAVKIERMLAGRDVTLVGVGAGHLVGATGLVELLKARGFAVRRL